MDDQTVQCHLCGHQLHIQVRTTEVPELDSALRRLAGIVVHDQCYDRVVLGIRAREHVLRYCAILHGKAFGSESVTDAVFNTAFKGIYRGVELYEKWLDIVAPGWRKGMPGTQQARERLARSIVERPGDAHRILNQFRHEATQASKRS